MGIQTVKIKYKNADHIVEFEDSLTFGDVEELVGGAVDLSDVTKPKVDLQGSTNPICTELKISEEVSWVKNR